jgi:hypothetical protein
MKVNIIFLILVTAVLCSCKTGIKPEVYKETIEKGNEISNLAQATLLSNVGKAMQYGGPHYAVEFCNLEASSIIDSLNGVNNCNISRVSNKNRNPKNKLQGKNDEELWQLFQNSSLADTLVAIDKSLVYYKPIKIAMPACLKCHGDPVSDINAETLNKLNFLYPEDLAKGYKLSDFRGLWKISFDNMQ